MNDPGDQPVFSHVEPVLAVADVTETIRYWQEVLAFPNKWTWGDPPGHGGVSWHGAHLQFTRHPERAKKSEGNYVWIRVKNLDELHKIHCERKADIVDELQKRPWGLHDYIVKDINGYQIVFAGHSADREKSGSFPATVQIIEKKMSLSEYESLMKSVGWLDYANTDHLSDRLLSPVYSVVAVDTASGETIGCTLILGDNASFYYIKDVIVKQEWQKKRIGTALMKAACDWLDKNGVPKSLVGLYTGENLEGFYKQFGFEKAFGMVKHV
ncbi:MAG TPA: GNAT family N-acetyltransferase [Cyclobacteriaceae bacterium]|nr:GNAT family N-acetyltransferase [Cyclobacteriaceae bacterium]